MDKKHKVCLYAASALIPCGILLAVFAMLGMIPFGDNTLLFLDSSIQYVDFASYLRTIFSGENDIFYTFSKNLGGEMLSLLAYYLISPFNLLFGLASTEKLPQVFTLVVVLKMAACGLTFFHASSVQFGLKTENLIFSTAYALMAYNTLYAWNILWLDGVLILPLLGLGLKRLWEEGTWKLYAFSVAYGLLTNFYVGYMLCIGSVLFFLTLMAVTELTLRERLTRFGRFAVASCIGGLSVAVVWVPTFLSLMSGRGTSIQENAFVWTPTFNILGLAGKLAAGASSPTQLEAGTPHIFCGIFTLYLVLCFFLQGKRSPRVRGAALALLGVFLISFVVRGFDNIWHGFSPNNAYNFRYSFLFSYVLLMLARHAFDQHTQTGVAAQILSAVLVLCMLLGLIVMKRWMGLDFLSPAGIAVSGAVLAIAFLFCLRGGKVLGGVFLAVCILEMGANYYLSMDVLVGEVPGLQAASYQASVEQTGAAVERVKEQDSGFYRMEKTYQRNKNDAMLHNYNGLTHFSSSQSRAVPLYMKKMGFTTYDNVWAQYGDGANAELDSLFGLKYVLSKTDLTASRGYVLLDTVEGVGIYENANALPVAMLADPELLWADMSGWNCFDMHESLWNGILGQDAQILLPVEAGSPVLQNLQRMENDSGTTTYVREDPAQDASVSWEIAVEEALPLYLYIPAPEAQAADLYVNGARLGSYFDTICWDVVDLGTCRPGETVTVSLVLRGQELTIFEPSLCYEDRTALAEASDVIRNRPVSLNRGSSSRLEGTFEAEEGQLLLFTIPAEKGWELTVDGNAVDTVAVGELFLAARVPAGTHSYRLKFTPPGLAIGGLASVMAFAAAAWLCLTEKRRK